MSLTIDQIISLVALIVTFIVALGTLVLAFETRRMRESQTDPEVFISFQPNEDNVTFVEIIIKNTGLRTAFDIQFKIDPDFKYYSDNLGDRYLSEKSYINNGIPYLAPNQMLKTFLTDTRLGHYKELSKPFKITINYKNMSGTQFERIYPIDIGSWGDVGYSKKYSIPDELNKIQEDIHKISNTLNEISKIKDLGDNKRS